MTFFLSSNMC